MTNERTEEAGLSGFLTVTVGGVPRQVRALTIAESDEWLDRYADEMTATDVMDGDTDAAMMRSLVKKAGEAALRLVLAYDIDGVLGDMASATKVEVANALKQMVTVEDPLAEDAGRLAVAAFGLPAQMAAERLEATTAPMLRLVQSLSTLSEPGGSTTPATSAPAGPVNNSSSTGRTRRTASAAKPTTAAS